MKLFTLFVNLIVPVIYISHLVCCVNGLPYPEPQGNIQTVTLPAAITADSVNNGIAFSQSFMQLLNMFLTNFNTMIPKFVELFTAAAAPSAGVLNTGGQSIPSIPSLKTEVPMGIQPENFNGAPAGSSIMPRDVELLDNEIISAAYRVPVWIQSWLCSFECIFLLFFLFCTFPFY